MLLSRLLTGAVLAAIFAWPVSYLAEINYLLLMLGFVVATVLCCCIEFLFIVLLEKLGWI